MSSNAEWFLELEDKYRSYFSTRMRNSLPDYTFNFPVESDNSTPTEFPTIYFHEIAQVEKGNDLGNEGVNAVLETIEVQVITNDTLSEIKDITAVATLLMKQMRFNIISAPTYLREGENIRRSISRYRRIIGSDDSV